MISIVAKNAERSRVQSQPSGLDESEVDPPRREAAPELAVAEQRDIARQRAEPDDQPVGAASDLVGRFATRTAVAKD